MRCFRSSNSRKTVETSRSKTNSLVSLTLLFFVSTSAAQSFGECEGDCRGDDFLCDFGLNCYSPKDKKETVPGCEKESSKAKGKDLCHVPPPNTLVYSGDDYNGVFLPVSVFPLKACQGDCDSDDECKGSLLCFTRDAFEEVPGCVGKGGEARDYCYDPKHNENAMKLPQNNKPSKETPAPTPKPKNKPKITPSPTSQPKSKPTKETAAPSKPPKNAETRAPTPIQTKPKPSNPKTPPSPSPPQLQLLNDDTYLPYRECEGECLANDSLCGNGLSCFAREFREPVPGCKGKGTKGADYCYKPPAGVLVFTSLTKDTLDRCEGSCTTNDDCNGSLLCFTRIGNESVPGCEGIGINTVNYCYDEKDESTPTPALPLPPTVAPSRQELVTAEPSSLATSPPTIDSTTKPTFDSTNSLTPTQESTQSMEPTSESESSSPSLAPSQINGTGTMKELVPTTGEAPILSLGQCEGGCSGDDLLCSYGFSCFSRMAKELVPGCLGEGEIGTNYCYTPPPDVLVYVGDDFEPDVFPLDRCNGDCDSDDDCKEGLRCWLRDSSEPIPGCRGNGIAGRDYCYDPNSPPSTLAPGSSLSGQQSPAFRSSCWLSPKILTGLSFALACILR